MRILIISLPRTGSTSLVKGLSESLEIECLIQPFSKYIWGESVINEIPNHNDLIVKTLINEYPSSCDDMISFYNNLITQFDKTILLTRKDLKLCAESYGYHLKHSSHEFWHKPYNYTSYDIDIDYYINLLNDLNGKLDILSKKNNISLDYYEQIFGGDVNLVEDFLIKHNIKLKNDKLFSYTSPVNKLRKLDFINKFI
jgi:hypothetical protein